jgi:hypothetical protein
MLTITLWTLLLVAESRGSSNMTSMQIPGFASREACSNAQALITGTNAQAMARSSRAVGENGVDIKLIMCVPVVIRTGE